MSDDLGDKFTKSFAYVLDGIQPGVTKSLEKVGSALSKDLSKGGKPVNLLDELIALFAGTRIIRIDVKKDLRYFTSTMNRLLRSVDETENFYSVENFADKPPSDLVKTFEKCKTKHLEFKKICLLELKI